MNPEEFKFKIKSILTQEFTIEFLGENFEKIVDLISDKKAEKIFEWIKKVLEENIRPILLKSDKKYKNWKINELLTFRYPFNINNIEYRILFVKVKNSYFIEFHLGDHKYYDKTRKELFLKEENNISS